MNVIKGGLGVVKDKVGGVADAAKETSVFKKIEDVAGDVKDTEAFQKIEAFKDQRIQELREFEEAQKQRIASLIYEKLDGVYEHAMAVANAKTKEAVYDPYMPDCLYDMLEQCIDSWWPDVKTEVRYVLLDAAIPDKMYHGEEPCCCGTYNPLAYIRYLMQPYDRSFWRTIRRPLWWIFTLLSLVPKYGCAVVMFTFYFLILDKQDEFQLLQFILAFKGMQFWSLGVFSCIVGSGMFFFCTSAEPDNCADNAPREALFTLALFVWQVILVLIAFWAFKYATSKGGEFHRVANYEAHKSEQIAKMEEALTKHEKYHETHADTVVNSKRKLSRKNKKLLRQNTSFKHALIHDNFLQCTAVKDEESSAKSKRRLRNFLIWDFFIFILCLGFAGWLAFHNTLDEDATVTKNKHGTEGENWRFQSGLYWIKVLYGLCSFPFLLLKIPGLNTMISHARPTAYNPYGNTVKYLGDEEDGPLPWDPLRPTKEQREAEEERLAEEERKQEEMERKQQGGDGSPQLQVVTNGGGGSPTAAGPHDGLQTPYQRHDEL